MLEDKNTYITETGALMSAYDYSFLSADQKERCKVYKMEPTKEDKPFKADSIEDSLKEAIESFESTYTFIDSYEEAEKYFEDNDIEGNVSERDNQRLHTDDFEIVIYEDYTFQAHHLFTREFDSEQHHLIVTKLLDRAWHWYKAYMEWEDSQPDR